MTSLLFPLCTFFLLCLCIAYWASTAVYPPLFFLLLLLTSLPPGRKLLRCQRSSRARLTSLSNIGAREARAAPVWR